MTDPSQNGEPEQSPAPTDSTGGEAVSRADYEKVQSELSEYKDKYLRSLAEMENARKRMIKERQEYIQHATASVIVEFLRPLDNLENALGFAEKMSKDVQNWATGFQMILSQFKDILVDHGVTPVISTGRPFDPHLHEAVENVETDSEKPGTIVEECSRGYCMGSRTIRPARVKVAKPKSSPQAPTSDEGNEEELN